MSPARGSADETAAHRRDRGLRRVGRTTLWVASAAAAGSVALASGYAQALPGKSAPTTPPSSTTAPATTAPSGTGTPSPPVPPPVAASPQQPQTTSGAS